MNATSGQPHENDPAAARPEAPVYDGPPPDRGYRSDDRGGRWGRRVHGSDYSAFNPRVKSPVIASFLSLIPGLGQIYVGYYAIGFLHALVVAADITLLAADVLDSANPLAALFLPFFWLYNIVDAGRRAAHYNLAIEGGEELPSPGALPSFGAGGGGLLPVGVGLVVLGGIFLSHTAYGYSLRWLEDWWPVAPIALGGYLIFRGLADRKKQAA